MPTWFGLGYAFVCALLFCASFSFNSNLSYFVNFLIISLGIVSMPITNKNIQQIYITDIETDPFESDHPGVVRVRIKNNGTWTAQGIKVSLLDCVDEIDKIEPGEEKEISLFLNPHKRGSYDLKRLKLESHFPFGLLRSWKYFISDVQYFVFPLRVGESQWPALSVANNDGKVSRTLNADIFSGHSKYTSRDSIRKIDWRVLARTNQLVVKQFESMSQLQADFTWQQTQFLRNHEQRLSQLALWVSEAENTGAIYSVSLPGAQFERARGFEHYNNIMKSLSVLNEK